MYTIAYRCDGVRMYRQHILIFHYYKRNAYFIFVRSEYMVNSYRQRTSIDDEHDEEEKKTMKVRWYARILFDYVCVCGRHGNSRF